MVFSRSVGLRMAIDAGLTTLALLAAFGIRYVMVVLGPTVVDADKLLVDYVRQFALSAWLLVALVAAIGYGMGVYHQVRSYRHRYKLMTIAQVVSIAHLIYGFAFYFTPLPTVPRGVVILSWVLGLGLLGGVRLAQWGYRTLEAAERLGGGEEPETASEPEHILVLGGAGYIGSAMLRMLLEDGYRVRLVDSLMYGDGAIKELYGHPRFEFIKGDFRHIETVVRALAGTDAVIHLGAIVGDPACAIDADFSTEINLIATRVLAEACKGYGIRRFIFASTCSVYGASNETLDERSALNPVSLYAQTKIDSENVLLSLADERFQPTIVRFATIYGLSPRPRFDLVVNLLTAKAVREGMITIFGGDQWRPFVHVADAARALTLLLKAPLATVGGEIFNVGSDAQNYTINQIGALIQGLIPTAQVVYQGDDTDRRNYRVSFAKLHRAIGFEPAHTIEDGVREIQAALVAGEISDYYDPAFNNHKFLTSPTNGELLRLLSPWTAPSRPSNAS